MSDADARTAAALEAGGFADMRPVLRKVMVRLKEQDPAAFAEATERYEADVAAELAAGGDTDPVAAWTAYGAWLAARFTPGRLVRLDESGLADRADPRTPPRPGHVLLHLPDEQGDSAIPLVRPAELSAAQQAALELLVR